MAAEKKASNLAIDKIKISFQNETLSKLINKMINDKNSNVSSNALLVFADQLTEVGQLNTRQLKDILDYTDFLGEVHAKQKYLTKDKPYLSGCTIKELFDRYESLLSSFKQNWGNILVLNLQAVTDILLYFFDETIFNEREELTQLSEQLQRIKALNIVALDQFEVRIRWILEIYLELNLEKAIGLAEQWFENPIAKDYLEAKGMTCELTKIYNSRIKQLLKENNKQKAIAIADSAKKMGLPVSVRLDKSIKFLQNDQIHKSKEDDKIHEENPTYTLM